MTNPPSFAPDPRRRRPTSGDARRIAATKGSSSDASARPTRRSSSLDQPIAHESRIPQAEAPAPAAEEPEARPQARSTPDGPAAQQWYVGDDDGGAKPLNPTTRDQPNDVAPSFMPQSRRRPRTTQVDHGADPEPTATMPPSYAPQLTHNPPAFAPESSRGAASPRPTAVRASSSRTSGARPVPAAPRAPRRAFPASSPRRKRRGGIWRPIRRFLLLLLVVIAAWASFLLWDANSNLGRTTALSDAADTPGTTYLLAGSDSRADGAVQDGFKDGERSDSIMLIHVAKNGQTSAISIPRDAYAEIPGYGWDKINSSYAYGGPSLLVESVETLTGLTVDHYVQVGMGGVSSLVDAVGGVELCYDLDVDVADDDPSGLVWEAGCHEADGTTALAFSRMRYADPEGDIGRVARQQQVISAVLSKAISVETLLNPGRTLAVERAGSSSFTVDEDSSVFDVARLVLAYKKASGAGLVGTPPIESLDYTTDAGASAVLLKDTTAPDFFSRLRDGRLTEADFE